MQNANASWKFRESANCLAMNTKFVCELKSTLAVIWLSGNAHERKNPTEKSSVQTYA